MRRQLGAGMLLVTGLALASACSAAPELADQGSSAVQAEEHRIETLLHGDLAASKLPADYGHSDCSVTVLRISGETSWAQAKCTVPADRNDGVQGAWSSPIRVDGDRVTIPADGAGYTASIEAMFPKDLAAYLLGFPTDRGGAVGGGH